MATALSEYLVTDDLTIILGLVAAGLFLLHNLYKPHSLVHPILLGRQSDVARMRHPGESAVYRNYGTGMMGRLTNPELRRRVSAIGTGLLKVASLTPGESNVLLLLNDGLEFLLSDLALASQSIPSFTLTSISLLSPVLDSHPPSAIITEAEFLPHLLELIYDTNEGSHHTIIVIGEPDVKRAQGLNQVRVLKFSELERQGALLEQAAPSATDPLQVFTVSFHQAPSGDLRGVQFTHENITSGVTALRAMMPSSGPVSPLDTVVSAHSLSSGYGRAVAYTAIFEGANFVTTSSSKIVQTENAQRQDLSDVTSVERYPIPSPTILFITPPHLTTLTSAIIDNTKKASIILYSLAWRHKLAGILEGFFTKQSLWDRLIFDGARMQVMSKGAGTVRAVVVSEGPVENQALTPARVALSVPLVFAHSHPQVSGPVFATHSLDVQTFPADTDSSGSSAADNYTFSYLATVGAPSINMEVKLKGVDDNLVENGGDPVGNLFLRGSSVGLVLDAEPEEEELDKGWIDSGERPPQNMSTTSAMELTDTQMLDYSTDSDYTMHATGHSSEWPSVEATMSDDHIPSATEYSETIEIDMEQNEDEEMTEYEMTDGVDYVHEGAVEIQDVDFAEPSQAASPSGVSAIDSTALVDATSSIAPPQSLPSPTAHLETYGFHHGALPSVPEHHISDVETLVHPAPLDTTEQPHEPPVELFALPTGENTDDSEESRATGRPASPARPTLADPAAYPEPESQPSFFEHEEDGASSKATGSEPAEAPGAEEGSLGGAKPLTELARSSDDVAHPVAYGEAYEETSNNDPHEISDGVYIDPPPPVLLSLSTSSQRVECCLFNQPYAGSRSQSPDTHASASTATEFALLLSQKPTLYYEPLNNVFEALRQEEVISGVAELADGELVLEAYDLDLRITEDNIHVGEVTIHELNILHDGIDLTGPLRLRLSATPRFITRYRALRDQVAQLSLEAGSEIVPQSQFDAAEPEEAAEEAVRHDALPVPVSISEVEHSGATEQAYDEEVNGRITIETAESEAKASALATNDEPGTTESGQREPLSGVEQEEPNRAVETGSEAPEDAATDYEAELTAGEAAQHFDADEVHQEADVGDGGDYTDYVENPDDDGQFGETPPEDSGAGSDVADGRYEVLADLYRESSTDAAGLEANAPGNELGATSEAASSDELVNRDPDATFTGQPFANIASHTELGELESLEEYDAEGEDRQGEESTHPQEEFEDWGEFDETEQTAHVAEDALSKGSSETLSTLSKRSREEDEGDEDDADSHPPGSSDSKRVRVG
ncbi:uncharacterized protein PHACADRAFT_161674 [Phanerochaete carnosa HHB-10118-sp]|uniref:AMP-dependent synthetase/ligase domain-containing protein n=1 Tax=Phanerochaete carnosa (strain HHB-10118-sp) TaxID=650164 RepID=K5W9J5_PHACS|nr:uncharacterized protein PHACADRAFT_161674 [Phanerochaete carnosa HHB-10118-sp]EKM55644.1 hypothetical protein PHACADRAFT_161674 [Phanerochaete carnosa HHB-10118-sp]